MSLLLHHPLSPLPLISMPSESSPVKVTDNFPVAIFHDLFSVFIFINHSAVFNSWPHSPWNPLSFWFLWHSPLTVSSSVADYSLRYLLDIFSLLSLQILSYQVTVLENFLFIYSFTKYPHSVTFLQTPFENHVWILNIDLQTGLPFGARLVHSIACLTYPLIDIQI